MMSLATASAAIDCASEWRVVDSVLPLERGHVVSKCRPPGSDYDAYRLEAVIDSPPALVAAAARAEMADPSSKPPRSRKTIVRDEGDELVVHMYADLPLVADRDAVTRARLSSDAQSGIHRLEWQATDREGPPPADNVVRIEKSTGSWTFVALDDAKTRAVYESHSELAGSVPAWLINSLMTEAVVDNIARLRARVKRDTKRPAE